MRSARAAGVAWCSPAYLIWRKSRFGALEHGIVIVAVVDAKFAGDRFVGAPVVPSIADVTGGFEALIVTDLEATEVSVRAAIDQFGGDRVLVPALLRILVDGSAQ